MPLPLIAGAALAGGSMAMAGAAGGGETQIVQRQPQYAKNAANLAAMIGIPAFRGQASIGQTIAENAARSQELQRQYVESLTSKAVGIPVSPLAKLFGIGIVENVFGKRDKEQDITAQIGTEYVMGPKETTQTMRGPNPAWGMGANIIGQTMNARADEQARIAQQDVRARQLRSSGMERS